MADCGGPNQRIDHGKTPAGRQLAPTPCRRCIDWQHAIGEGRLKAIHPDAKLVGGGRISRRFAATPLRNSRRLSRLKNSPPASAAERNAITPPSARDLRVSEMTLVSRR